MKRPPTTPREAFAEFAEIERRFGTDDSTLFKVLHALIEQGERHEQLLHRHHSKIAFLLSLGPSTALPPGRAADAIEHRAEEDRDTLPAIPVAAKRESP